MTLLAMGGARIFVVWGQRGGRAKGKGGQQQGIMSLASSHLGASGGQLPTPCPPLAPPMCIATVPDP